MVTNLVAIALMLAGVADVTWRVKVLAAGTTLGEQRGSVGAAVELIVTVDASASPTIVLEPTGPMDVTAPYELRWELSDLDELPPESGAILPGPP